MLGEKTKQNIRDAYKAIGNSLPNFVPRKQQNLLIAEIAKTLAGEYSKTRKIITCEAGTGTGKSLAYSLGVIPLALKKNIKVIISTATVALQEQLVDKDLPFLQQHAGIDFQFSLVKGRQRYVCAQKLAQATQTDEDTIGAQIGFFDVKPKEQDIKTLNQMADWLKRGKWSGDIDSWPDAVPSYLWQQIQSDKHSCLRHVGDHQHCPFHKAREQVELADVLVVNHSLLLADLELGGGKILPSPQDSYYVIDEAHHLPRVTRDHASAMATVKGAIDWLSKLNICGDNIAKLCQSQKAIGPSISLADYCVEIIAELTKVDSFLNANQAQYFANDELYRFELGLIPQQLKHHSEDIHQLSNKCLNQLTKLYNLLLEDVKEGDVKTYLAEPLLAEAGFFLQRLENLTKLWQLMAKTDSEKAAPLARWLEKTTGKRDDILVCAAPIEVGFFLEDALWSQCEGAVLCSATLKALNSFDHFRLQSGLQAHDGSQYITVESPFDYANNGVLRLLPMSHEPSSDKFTDEVIIKLPTLISEKQGNLVLFTSYKQMQTVAEALRKNKKFIVEVQGEKSRQEIIQLHKDRCDKQKTSIIFGTQSFSEGLDLPGHYLTNLVITKLPFSVPTSPVDEAQAEYVKEKGGNPFMQISLPDASKKLIQSCGRLLRNEKDTGVITLLDKRLTTKRYGQNLLDGLPPFKVVRD